MSPTSSAKTWLLQLFGSSKATNDNLANAPAALTAEPVQPQFRTDTDSSDTLTLPDGRKLGYAQYGSLNGRPILFVHGLPGSRLEGAGFHALGLELGARVIAVDRPGIGWSSPHPNRTLLDHPKDLERLAEYLGLDHYSVLGISGGGPSALACARAMPSSKLRSVSLVCAMGPPDIGMSGADLLHKLGFPYGFRYAPLTVARWFWQNDVLGRLDLTDEKRLEIMLRQPVGHEKDIAFMKSAWLPLSLRSSRESFSQGFEGVWQDGKLMCMDFGFQVEDIRHDLPVNLWYGKLDTFVPPNHGVQIAARLGENAHLRLVDETHASIVINQIREIFEDLIRST